MAQRDQNNMRLAFTLLELMITVAIIGILAAVAIPGFKGYMVKTKATEARVLLHAIGEGAIAYYSTEHLCDKSGGRKGQTIANQYPSSSAMSCIKGNGNRPNEIGNVEKSCNDPGWKHSPTEKRIKENLGQYPWKYLNFQITEPFYYTYNYYGTAAGTDNDGKYGDGFVASASGKVGTDRADVSGRASRTCDSGFLLVGGKGGKLSGIIDNSDFKKCPPGKAWFESDCKKTLQTFNGIKKI